MDCSLDSEQILQVSSKYLLYQQSYYKMSKFLHNNFAAKAIRAIPPIFSENSQAKNLRLLLLDLLINRHITGS